MQIDIYHTYLRKSYQQMGGQSNFFYFGGVSSTPLFIISIRGIFHEMKIRTFHDISFVIFI